MSQDSCPRCGHSGKAGLSTSHFWIYKCEKCGEKYCHECHGSNGGEKCPECGSHDKSHHEKVYLKD